MARCKIAARSRRSGLKPFPPRGMFEFDQSFILLRPSGLLRTQIEPFTLFSADFLETLPATPGSSQIIYIEVLGILFLFVTLIKIAQFLKIEFLFLPFEACCQKSRSDSRLPKLRTTLSSASRHTTVQLWDEGPSRQISASNNLYEVKKGVKTASWIVFSAPRERAV